MNVNQMTAVKNKYITNSMIGKQICFYWSGFTRTLLSIKQVVL